MSDRRCASLWPAIGRRQTIAALHDRRRPDRSRGQAASPPLCSFCAFCFYSAGPGTNIAPGFSGPKLRREASNVQCLDLPDTQAVLLDADGLAVALGSLSDGFWHFDRDWRLMFANPAACDAVRASPDQLAGVHLWEAFPALVGTSVESEARRAATERVPVTVEHYCDPLSRWFEIKASPTPDGGLTIVSRDISQAKRAEAELRESEARFRLACDASRAMVFHLDLVHGGRITAHGLERVTGYSPEDGELTLDRWLALIHPDDLPGHRQTLATHIETGGPYSAAYRLRHKDGRWVWLETRSQVIKNAAGVAIAAVGTLVDITAQKQASDALVQSEQRLRALHALGNRLASARDLAGALQDVLDGAIAACGHRLGNIQLYHPQRRVLEIVAQRGFLPPFLEHFREVRVEEDSACARVLGTGERMIIEDVMLDAAFEPHREVAAAAGYRAVHSTPLKAHDGSIVGIVSVHFPEPRRLPQLDQQLLDMHARLAADVIARLRYEQTLHDLERRKDEFLAMLAHELRNPMAAVQTSLYLLNRSRCDAAVAERACATIDRQISHILRLVDDLMDIGRIKANKLELRMQRLELAPVLGDAIEACQPLLERAHHSMDVALPDAPIVLRGDPVRLRQVFANLITNSCKYTEPAGRISVSATCDEHDVHVCVADTGCGIDPETLPRVFDLFMQDGRTLHRCGGGLGIGLPLVKRLVEMHGGRIDAHSDGIGRGSRFSVCLPLLVDTPAPAPAPAVH